MKVTKKRGRIEEQMINKMREKGNMKAGPTDERGVHAED